MKGLDGITGYSSAMALALRYLSRRSRTTMEMEAKLRDKGFDLDTVSVVIARLREIGYLNDIEYARQWVTTSSHRSWGRYRLLSGLMRHGFSHDQAWMFLDAMLTLEDEAQRAVSAARRRYRLDEGGETDWFTIAGFLKRKGFSGESLRLARELLAQTVLATLDNPGKEE